MTKYFPVTLKDNEVINEFIVLSTRDTLMAKGLDPGARGLVSLRMSLTELSELNY